MLTRDTDVWGRLARWYLYYNNVYACNTIQLFKSESFTGLSEVLSNLFGLGSIKQFKDGVGVKQRIKVWVG